MVVATAEQDMENGTFERKALDFETEDALEYINKVVYRNYKHLDEYLKAQLRGVRMLPPDYDIIKKLIDEVQEKILIIERLVRFHDYYALECDRRRLEAEQEDEQKYEEGKERFGIVVSKYIALYYDDEEGAYN